MSRPPIRSVEPPSQLEGRQPPDPGPAGTPPRADPLDALLPRSLGGASREERGEARRVAAAALVLLGCNAFFLVLTQLRDLPPFQALGLAGGIVYGVGVLVLLRVTGRYRLAGTLLIAGFAGVLAFQCIVDLGITNPALVPSLLVPFLAALLLPRSYVGPFGAAVVALYVGLYVAHLLGWDVPFRATDEDVRVYLVVIYCSTVGALSALAYAYAGAGPERSRLLADLERERSGRRDDRREHRDQLDSAIEVATAEARRNARLYRDRLTDVLYATRLEASALATLAEGGAPSANGRDVAVRLMRLANAYETVIGLERRAPRPLPIRLSVLVRRAVADVAAAAAPSSNVQFWIQREGGEAPHPPMALHGGAGEVERLTAPEPTVVADRDLVYWALRLVVEYAADTAPHGHVTVTLHDAVGEGSGGESLVSLSVHATNSTAALHVHRDLQPRSNHGPRRPGDLVGVLGSAPDAETGSALVTDTTARDVRLALAQAVIERSGGRLDVVRPSEAPTSGADGPGESRRSGGANAEFAWLHSPDELHVRVTLARPEIPTPAERAIGETQFVHVERGSHAPTTT